MNEKHKHMQQFFVAQNEDGYIVVNIDAGDVFWSLNTTNAQWSSSGDSVQNYIDENEIDATVVQKTGDHPNKPPLP